MKNSAGMCRRDLSAGRLTPRPPGGRSLKFIRRTLVISNAGADAGTGGGQRSHQGPGKQIGGKEGRTVWGAKGRFSRR